MADNEKKLNKRTDGRLQSKVYIGDGKYKYVYAKTPKELKQKILDVKMLLKKGVNVLAERDTFKDWAEQWLLIKQSEVSNRRYDSYCCSVGHLESISCLPIAKIRTQDIQSILIRLAGVLSEYTLNQIKCVAYQVIQLAIDNRVLDYNPIRAVKIPKSKTQKVERRALTETEQTWITGTEHRAKRAAMIMMYAGLRRGELIPLLWSDIDLVNKTISVNKAVEMIGGKPVIKDTAKTDTSIRTIYIPQVLVNFLKTENRNNYMLVCPSAKGTLMSGSAWVRLWDSYLTELNFKFGDFSEQLDYEKPKSKFAPQKTPMVIPKITAHWLRHTFITLMYLAGVDVLTAKEQAGHADIRTTMNIYTHLDSVYKIKQVSKLDDYINKTPNVASN